MPHWFSTHIEINDVKSDEMHKQFGADTNKISELCEKG